MNSLTDKVALVTGATSGIGKATALGLAKLGATVVLVARDRSKGEATRSEIAAVSGNQRVDLLTADLSSQQSIRQLATDFKAKYQQLHILVNNAGGIFGERELTVDGLEYTFALNHLAYFLLTNLLLDVLKASAPARIVNLASGAQQMGVINFDDLQGAKRYGGQAAYSQSKLANVMFTYELARRLKGSGVTVNCVQPGIVRTNFGNSASWAFRLFVRVLTPFMKSPEQGAETPLYLASSPEVEGVSGQYFIDKKPQPSSKLSYDEAAAQRLWQVSAELTRLSGSAPA